jgi:hypothetical protein
MFMRDDVVTQPEQIPVFAAPELEADWRILCTEIGERRAGTAEEQRAADFIAERFRTAGGSNVEIEKFPCASLRSATAEVHERTGRSWRAVDARALVGAPGTPGGRAVHGELGNLPQLGYNIIAHEHREAGRGRRNDDHA